jgi:2-C-methyl-D-erythritol 2,4-cyclodiphosphate synthase
MRVGTGYDIHRLVPGKKLFLGGAEIPSEKGLEGHSDGDALAHAIADAMLGALGKDDIGAHFPDTDMKFKGVSGAYILNKVREMMFAAGFSIGNIDCNIIAETPKIAPHREKIRASIASILGIGSGKINVKGRTNEKLGEIGRGEALAVQAVVLLLGKEDTHVHN